jgi:hypothetical protein
VIVDLAIYRVIHADDIADGCSARVRIPAKSRTLVHTYRDMQTQQRDIEEMLLREGWHIVERQVCPEWWLDEVWVIESAWTPVRTRTFVSFLVDPQAPTQRAKGEDVWAVCATLESAASTPMGEDSVPLGPRWDAMRREEVLKRIRSLRALTQPANE